MQRAFAERSAIIVLQIKLLVDATYPLHFQQLKRQSHFERASHFMNVLQQLNIDLQTVLLVF